MECENAEGHHLDVVDRDIPILWPWDVLHWRDTINFLGCWIADQPHRAGEKCMASCIDQHLAVSFATVLSLRTGMLFRKRVYSSIAVQKKCLQFNCSSEKVFTVQLQ